jgi:hypothetical protein
VVFKPRAARLLPSHRQEGRRAHGIWQIAEEHSCYRASFLLEPRIMYALEPLDRNDLIAGFLQYDSCEMCEEKAFEDILRT